MELSKTNRGFSISSFKDAYGEECRLQKLLPFLIRFAETGELYETEK